MRKLNYHHQTRKSYKCPSCGFYRLLFEEGTEGKQTEINVNHLNCKISDYSWSTWDCVECYWKFTKR